MAVARAGEEAVPVEPSPVALRPFLQFVRLPGPALVAARRVLEADETFRARVADEVSEEQVGRAGWLFLTRPPGWQEDFEALVSGAEEAQAEVADRRAENEARRRLAAVEAAARRAEDLAAESRAEAERAGEALADERKARRDAMEDAAKLARRGRELQAERDRALATAAVAEGKSRAAEAEIEVLRAEVEALQAEVEVKRAELRAPPPAPPVLVTEPANVDAGAALGTAARAARGLADALAAAADALARGERAPSGPLDDPGPVPGIGPSPAARERPRTRPARAPRRSLAPLPPGILEESSEAAEHLVRLRHVVLLVDGYNVSQAAWPGMAIAEQRRRLVDALGELAARTGADIRVVFDGAETVDPPSVSTTSRVVRVRFSPPDVEADDVIVAEVAALPPGRPVVVASSDRRVRDESRAHGANLLRSAQLLALLRLR